MKYAWMKEHRDQYTIKQLCRVLQVSKSGFYAWRKRRPSSRANRTALIHQSVEQVFKESHGIYGSYKIAEELKKDERLEHACRNTVAKAMRELGLKSRVRKKFTPTTTVNDPTQKPAPNVLGQDFQATRPNQKWVADITYLPTATGWVYLAVVLDLYSRKIVGWEISESLATPLVSNALRKAIESRRPDTSSLLHHSDRGCQYTSDSFQQTLRVMGIECSMSRTGCCYDNAVAERFFWSLKHEWTKFEQYQNLLEAKLSVFKYIETFYNSVRIHQTLNFKSPNEFEKLYYQLAA